MKGKNLSKFIDAAIAIDGRDAKEAGALGYMGRALVQATMPHKPVQGNEFVRKNGAYTLTMVAPSKTGLPYGATPRLLMAWITTEAVKTKNRELILGASLSEFMEKLDMVPTGGRWGSITRLKDQMSRLFSTSISCSYDLKGQSGGVNMHVADEYHVWWEPKEPSQSALWESTIILSSNFYEEITERPVPVDMDALKALKRSPLALDIYCWLTYRMSYLKHSTDIHWEALQAQFGCGYAPTTQGNRNFKKAFLRELRKVCAVYPSLKVEDNASTLVLIPGKTHIKI